MTGAADVRCVPGIHQRPGGHPTLYLSSTERETRVPPFGRQEKLTSSAKAIIRGRPRPRCCLSWLPLTRNSPGCETSMVKRSGWRRAPRLISPFSRGWSIALAQASDTARVRPSVCASSSPTSRAHLSYTHLRAHETDSYLVCRLLLEKKKPIR